MTNRSVLLFPLVMAGFVSIAEAGSAPDGYSSVNGYFLGFENEAYLSVENSKSYVEEIEAICKRKGTFWALGVGSPFTCTGFRYIEEGGNGPVYGLDLKSTAPIKGRPHALLFSSKPFLAPTWTERAATRDEVDNLLAAPLRGEKYSSALRNARAGKAKAIDVSNYAAAFIVPWRTVSDGIVVEKEFLLVAKRKTGAYETSEVRGRIVGFADINDDGIPELIISTNCDGICQYVISIASKNSVRIYISNH